MDNIDILEFGKRVKEVRTQVLELNQSELAGHLNSKQTLIYRLESGKGCSIDLALNFISFLNKKGMAGHYLLAPQFNLAMLNTEHTINVEQLVELLKESTAEHNKNIEEIILRMKTL